MTTRDDARTWASEQPMTDDLALPSNNGGHSMCWTLLVMGAGREVERRGLSDQEAGEFLLGLYEYRAQRQAQARARKRASA